MSSTNSQWVQVLDEHGQAKLLPFEQALEIERQRAIAQDKDLNIQRSQAPVLFINLPDQPESLDCQRLAIAIRDVAAFKDIAPETQDQAFWMRCVQLYWQAKAIALSNEIYKLIPDPTRPPGPVWGSLHNPSKRYIPE